MKNPIARKTKRVVLSVSAAALVVTLLSVTPGLAAFNTGPYVGTSSQEDQIGQKLNIGVKVNRARTRVQFTYFEMLNTGCDTVTQIAGKSAKLKRSGKFSYKPADIVYGNGYIKGKFKGRTVSGTAKFPGRCGGLIRWSARKQR